MSFLLFTFFTCLGKQYQDNRNLKDQPDYFIQWDNSTLICIADEGVYPRMRRLADHSLLVVYENRRGDLFVKKSLDEGSSWTEPVLACEGFDYCDEITGETTKVNIANPEIITLDNGHILLASNQRPLREGIYPFSIALQRSVDNGVTWTEPQILYQAGTYFKDGCWEPSFLQLPEGTIQLYFANESPYRDSDEQEISMIASLDNGRSWTKEPTTVSFRKGKRDGMPVAVHDHEHIYVVIEDNLSRQFKPYLVRSAIDQAWVKPVLENSACRYSALKYPLAEEVYAGAPYLIRTDNGLYVISYQTTENRSADWELSTMEVVVSDRPADFRNPSRPFDLPLSKQAKWNALVDLGDNIIAAISSANIDSDTIGVWMIKGEIVER